MKHLIFNTEQEALALNSRVTNNAILTFWTDGITNNYCIPKKHPTLNKWAVIIDEKYAHYFSYEEISNSVELGNDWNPIILI